MTGAGIPTHRLSFGDMIRLAAVGVRTRRLRAGLSALGIAVGVAAIVAVLGLSASSRAGLLAEIDQLGTNMLTVKNGRTLFGQTAELPSSAVPMIGRTDAVQDVQSTGMVTANAYRSPLIPAVDTNALAVMAASEDLLPCLGTGVAHGAYLMRPPRDDRWRCWAPQPHNGSASRPSFPVNACGWAATGSTSRAS